MSEFRDDFDHREDPVVVAEKPGKRRSKSKSSSTSEPKGILKNSNPHAAYKSSSKLEELLENERPRAHGGGGGHHRHHHKSKEDGHHKKHSSSKSHHDHGGEERKKSSSHKHHKHSSDKKRSSSGKRHKHRHSSGDNSTNTTHASASTVETGQEIDDDVGRINGRAVTSTTATNPADSIYDQPRVPAVKYMQHQEEQKQQQEVSKIYNAIVKAAEASDDPQGFYENLGFAAAKKAFGEGEGSGGVEEAESVGRNKANHHHQSLYDVPKSNKRVFPENHAVDAPEAIYVNDIANDDDGADDGDFDEAEQYDVPKNNKSGGGINGVSLADLIPQDYDSPKTRDSLSTIEEEQHTPQQENYDFPIIVKDEDLVYQNSGSIGRVDQSNKSYIVEYTTVAPSTHSTGNHNNHNNVVDDRSSGYRSSSSPSIQSTDDLYVNERTASTNNGGVGMLLAQQHQQGGVNMASMEDLDSCGSSHKLSSPEPHHNNQYYNNLRSGSNKRDIAIETTLERPKPRPTVKQLEDDQAKRERELAKERAREREREKAEEIEREIRRKRDETKSRFQKPVEYFNNRVQEEQKRREKNHGSAVNGGEDGEIRNKTYFSSSSSAAAAHQGTKKPDAAAVPTFIFDKRDDDGDGHRNDGLVPSAAVSPLSNNVVVSGNNNNGNTSTTSRTKQQQQRDRSVDVYHETVRQRATSSLASSKDLFAITRSAESELVEPLEEVSGGQEKEVVEVEEEEEEDMPSVRQLRSKFEKNSSSGPSASLSKMTSSSGKNKSKGMFNKKPSSSFAVMASLTRRGAVAMSKSLQSLDIKSKSVSEDSSCGNNGFSIKATSSSEALVDEESLFTSSELRFGTSGHQRSKKSSSKSQHHREIHSHASGGKQTDGGPLDKKLEVAPVQFGREENFDLQRQGHAEEDDDDESVDDDVVWDPVRFVARMYKMPKLSEDEVAKNSADAAHFRGNLERLPPGKKKSTLWNNWKKMYFVAERGFLQVRSNSKE